MDVPSLIPVLLIGGVVLWLVWVVGSWIFTRIFDKGQRETELRRLRLHDIQDDITSTSDFFVHNETCICGAGFQVLVGMHNVKKFNNAYMDNLQKQVRRGY